MSTWRVSPQRATSRPPRNTSPFGAPRGAVGPRMALSGGGAVEEAGGALDHRGVEGEAGRVVLACGPRLGDEIAVAVGAADQRGTVLAAGGLADAGGDVAQGEPDAAMRRLVHARAMEQ